MLFLIPIFGTLRKSLRWDQGGLIGYRRSSAHYNIRKLISSGKEIRTFFLKESSLDRKCSQAFTEDAF